MRRFAERLGHFRQRRIRLGLDQFANRLLVGVIVGALIVMPG